MCWIKIWKALDLSNNPLILIFAYKRFEFLDEILGMCFQDAPDKHVRLIVDGAENTGLRRIQKNRIGNLLTNFPRLEVVLRPANLGLRRNILLGITEALQDYDSVIILEDDCVPEVGFIEFALGSLQKYKEDKRVRSICGFVPGKVDLYSRTITFERLSQRFIPWGWATWADRWVDYETDSNYLLSQCERKTVNLPKDLEVALQRLASTNTEQNIWSVNWSTVHFLSNTAVIYPPRGLIQNRGFDGLGVHTGVSRTFENINTLQGSGKTPQIESSLDFSSALSGFMEKHWEETLIPIQDRLDS